MILVRIYICRLGQLLWTFAISSTWRAWLPSLFHFMSFHYCMQCHVVLFLVQWAFAPVFCLHRWIDTLELAFTWSSLLFVFLHIFKFALTHKDWNTCWQHAQSASIGRAWRFGFRIAIFGPGPTDPACSVQCILKEKKWPCFDFHQIWWGAGSTSPSPLVTFDPPPQKKTQVKRGPTAIFVLDVCACRRVMHASCTFWPKLRHFNVFS